ncbi:MAG: hypothetical protein NVS9B15_25120 [Acidobacteriaceae bacterium]
MFSSSSPEPRWGLHLEGQLRRSDVVANEQQLLLRLGMFRNVGKQQRLIGGYTYVRNTPPPGSVAILGVAPRHTLYAEYSRGDTAGWAHISQYGRLENTFAGSRRNHPDLSYSVRQRIRYHLALRIDANDTHTLRPAYYTIYDEVAIRIQPPRGLPLLNTNRTYFAAGWHVASRCEFELAYMYQYRPLSNGIVAEQNHSVQFTIISTRSLLKLFR